MSAVAAESTAPVIDVVVRCRNEMPYAQRTLAGLFAQQGLTPRVLFLDCGSTDGSREEAERAGATVHPIEPRDYIPGAVLNLGMRLTSSPQVAFINADAVPLSTDALHVLLEPLAQPEVAATFARQVARPDADRLTRLDYERTFGDEAVKMQHGAFFSMAASALRRDVWSALPFDERLRFSEDADWTQRALALGWRIAYVPQTRFEHSHAYDLSAQLRRRRGEGVADTAIFRLGAPSPVRELLRPLAGSFARDLRSGVVSPEAALIRTTQVLGRFAGRRAKPQRAPSAPSPLGDAGSERLTLGGEAGAELGVAALLADVRDAVRSAMGAELRALALVGSYARGEGGAVASPGRLELSPYNDLDLIAVVPEGAERWRRTLRPLCAAWSQRFGIDVDVWAIDESFLKRVPATLFWLDISLGGARVLWGSAASLKGLGLSARDVPLDEAGRLLANRATGIALSNFEGGDEPMARHIHKSVLACGDALLLAADRYRPTLRARLAELERLEGAPAVGPLLVARYRDALRYRARPDLWTPAQPRADWYAAARAEIAGWHFAFESYRRGAPGTPAAFARWGGRLYQRLPDVRRGGALFSSLRAAASGRFPLFPFLGHPRERLARASVALAYGHGDPAARAAAAALLGIPADAPAARFPARLRDLTARAG